MKIEAAISLFLSLATFVMMMTTFFAKRSPSTRLVKCRLIKVFSVVVAVIAIIAGIGQLVGSTSLHNWGGADGMAVNTAVNFSALACCVFVLADIIEKQG